jgi:hypothetical protein
MSQLDAALGPDPTSPERFAAQFVPDAAADFAEQSQLTYLVPTDSNLDLETAFKDLEPGTSILSIDQRESLFFGNLSPLSLTPPT